MGRLELGSFIQTQALPPSNCILLGKFFKCPQFPNLQNQKT